MTEKIQPSSYIDGNPCDSWGIDPDEFYREVNDNIFHIGQCYEEEPAKTLECVKCGGHEFNVGQGSYFTAIRCIKCEWELCIHEG